MLFQTRLEPGISFSKGNPKVQGRDVARYEMSYKRKTRFQWVESLVAPIVCSSYFSYSNYKAISDAQLKIKFFVFLSFFVWR